jgi:hypothetical protein
MAIKKRGKNGLVRLADVLDRCRRSGGQIQSGDVIVIADGIRTLAAIWHGAWKLATVLPLLTANSVSGKPTISSSCI